MTGPPPGLSAGFAVPQVFPDGSIDLALIREISVKAESAGYDSLWTQEQLIGQAQSLEPLVLLSYLAAFTERVRLGVSVLVLPVRSPLHLAKQLASLDVLSGGRLTVGVGLGGDWDSAAFGVPEGRRVRRFLDVLQAMQALWTQDAAEFDGQFFQLHGVRMNPKPLQKPHPPIWFGARTEPALRRAARHADGWMGPGSSTTEAFRRHVVYLRDALEEAGRDPERFAISKRVYIAVDDDAERAERRLREWFAHNYLDAEMATRVSIWGRPEHCHERLEELIDAGARHLLLNPVFDYEEHLEALSRYAG